jgi:quercetin dioxygenase-like cupin family protein
VTHPIVVDADHAAATADLNATVVRLAPAQSIGAHVNDARDILVVVLNGGGTLTCDGVEHPLGPSTVVIVPMGAERSIAAGPHGIEYVSAHRVRPGPTIG